MRTPTVIRQKRTGVHIEFIGLLRVRYRAHDDVPKVRARPQQEPTLLRNNRDLGDRDSLPPTIGPNFQLVGYVS